MIFASLLARQKEQSKAIASQTVALGRRRFFKISTLTAGAVFWLGINAFFLTRGFGDMRGPILVGFEAVFFLLCMFFGFLFSLSIWRYYTRLAKSK